MRAFLFTRTLLFVPLSALFFVPIDSIAQQSTDTAALSAAIKVRLDSRTPSYNDNNDRGAARTVMAVGDFMRSFESQVSSGRIEDAKQATNDLFSFLPADDAGFVSFLSASPRNAPALVAALRSAITKASELSVESAALRTLFLERVGETMSSHIELAAEHGPAYLQLFNKWTYAIVGWRYLAGDPRTYSTTRENLLRHARSLSNEERARIAQNDGIYRRGFAIMMCPRLFTPVR